MTSTTPARRAVLSSGVINEAQQGPLLIIGDQPVPSPAVVGFGVPGGVMSAQIEIGARMDPSSRRAWVVIDDVDDTADYTVTVGGTSVVYSASGGDGKAEVLEGLRALIAASSPITGRASASVLDTWRGDQTVPALYLSGVPGQDWSLSVSATGDGEIAAYAEPVSAEVDVYVRTGARLGSQARAERFAGDDVRVWRAVANGIDVPVDARGIAQRLDVSGYVAVYPRFYAMVKHPDDGAEVEMVPFAALYVGVG